MQKNNDNIVARHVLDINIQNEISSFGVEQKMNDYIGMQKVVLPELEKQGLFREVINKESGMIIEITKKGIKETFGSGNRFQSLPRKLKELKIATLRNLPEIIQEAHLVKDNVLNFHGNAAEYAYLALEVDINGLFAQVRIDVKKTPAKNKFWLHMIDINEKNPITQP